MGAQQTPVPAIPAPPVRYDQNAEAQFRRILEDFLRTMGARTVTTDWIEAGAITRDKHAGELQPMETVAALPSLPSSDYPEGAVVYLTSDQKLYRSTGSAWSTAVDGADVQLNTILADRLDVGSLDAVAVNVLQDLYVAADKRIKFGSSGSPTTITKTLRIPFPTFVTVGSASDVAYLPFSGYLHPDSGQTPNNATVVAPIVLPVGVEITGFTVRAYRETTSDSVTADLYRFTDGGANASTLDTVSHSSTGWQEFSSTTLSSSVAANNQFYLNISMSGNDGDGVDARLSWAEITYEAADLAQAI